MDLKLIAKRAYSANALRGIYHPFYTKYDSIAKMEEEQSEYIDEVTLVSSTMSDREAEEMADCIIVRLTELVRCGRCAEAEILKAINKNETRTD